MKKITFQLFGIICLTSVLSFGQTYTSGLFNIVNTFDAQIDINVTTNIVTLTLIGPDPGWLAMGFDSNGHDSADVVMFDNVNLSDRWFTNSFGEPNIDSSQDWTVTNNTTNGGIRTVIATRARDTGDANDYVFSTMPGTLDIVGGYNSSFNMGNRHDERDFATATFSLLGLDDIGQITFTMAPNPTSKYLKVVLPSNLRSGTIEIFDMLSRKIYDIKLTNSHYSVIDVSYWNSGVYLVKVSNGVSTQTKRFIKQ